MGKGIYRCTFANVDYTTWDMIEKDFEVHPSVLTERYIAEAVAPILERELSIYPIEGPSCRTNYCFSLLPRRRRGSEPYERETHATWEMRYLLTRKPYGLLDLRSEISESTVFRGPDIRVRAVSEPTHEDLRLTFTIPGPVVRRPKETFSLVKQLCPFLAELEDQTPERELILFKTARSDSQPPEFYPRPGVRD